MCAVLRTAHWRAFGNTTKIGGLFIPIGLFAKPHALRLRSAVRTCAHGEGGRSGIGVDFFYEFVGYVNFHPEKHGGVGFALGIELE